MPVIRFHETVPTEKGTAPARGYISFTPVLPYFKGENEHVLPRPFREELDEGLLEVYLDPTDGWSWEVSLDIYGIRRKRTQTLTYHVLVPDVEGPVNWKDLTHVSPRSLSTTTPGPAWAVELRSLSKVISDLEEKHDREMEKLRELLSQRPPTEPEPEPPTVVY